MPLNYDIVLLAISTIAASASTLIAFGFLDRINRSANKAEGMLPITISLAMGTAIFANHFIILLSANLGALDHASWAMLHAWLFATGIGACVIYIATMRTPKLGHILTGGFIGGICDLGLFYTSHVAIFGTKTVSINPTMGSIATVFSIAVISFVLLQFQWVRTYSGPSRLLMRTAVATGIALSILSVHFLFHAAFSDSMIGSIEIPQSQPSTNLKLTAIAIALGMICLFLISFTFVLFYERNGKKIFNFNLFNASDDNDEVEQDSLQDSLTKLPNRRAFETHLKSAEKRCIRSGKSFALAYIDLDYFKPINDNYGHHVGDAVLSITAERLNTAVRGCDFVARIGGDEFVAIIEEINTEEDVRPIAERIVNSIKEAYFIDHLNIELSCSLGIALYPKDSDIDKLLVCADAAMYKAKDQGKNQYKFYDTEIESANDIMLHLQKDLCQAIENKEFSIVYLPKIDCKTLTAIGAEALIRWNHPTKGVVLPNDFLPAAEHFGLIQEINNWVIEECCSTLANAKQANLDLNISINLSSYQFSDPSLVKNIIQKIQHFDLNPSNISFEIKETIAINNQNQFKSLLDKFKNAGIKVILDDFGLLPISLTYLLDLNIDEVKIDKSFIGLINKDQGAMALIDAVFKLTHALGFKVTAEGIEDESQQEAIIDLGCDYMQGYLFSKPINEVELFELYEKLQFKQLQIDFGNAMKKIKKS
jgi:diguanylate cyclase